MEFVRAYFCTSSSASRTVLYFKAFLPLAVCIELRRLCDGVVAHAVCTYVCNTRRVNTQEEKTKYTRTLVSQSRVILLMRLNERRERHAAANVISDMLQTRTLIFSSNFVYIISRDSFHSDISRVYVNASLYKCILREIIQREEN